MRKNRDLNADQNRLSYLRYLGTYLISVFLVGLFSYQLANQPCKEEIVLKKQLNRLLERKRDINTLNAKMDSLQNVLNNRRLSPDVISLRSHELMVEIETFSEERSIDFGAYHNIITQYIDARKTAMLVSNKKREIRKLNNKKKQIEQEERKLNQKRRICCPY